MYPVPGICPVCGDELSVTRLHCGRCDTTLEGLFTLGRFHYLTREQQQFIAIFIKCRGKIKDVEDELGISYPTVVARLDEAITSLGFAEPREAPKSVAQPAGPAPELRRVVLDELSKGHITSEEALALMRGQDIAAPPLAPAPPAAPAPARPAAPRRAAQEAAPVVEAPSAEE